MIAALSVPEHCSSFYFVCDDGLTKFSVLCDYITTSHFLTTRPAVGYWLGKKVYILICYLLTDGFNCLTVKYLAGWHLESRAVVLKLVSFPVY